MEQTQLQGLKHFAQTIEPLMSALYKDKVRKLSDTEANRIVQFYLEVKHYLYKQS